MKRLFHLQSVLPKLYQDKNWEQQWDVQILYTKWPQIIGIEASQLTRPAYIQQEVLWLYVIHPIWAQDIQYRQADLIIQIRRFLPELRLRQIRSLVQPAFFAADHDDKNESPEQGQKELALEAVKTLQTAEDRFAAVADPECKRALARMWLALQAKKE